MNQGKFIRNLILLLMLALLCVGTTELVACRFADPVLFETVISPVRYIYHGARQEVKRLVADYARWQQKLEEEKERRAEEARLRAEEARRQAEEEARRAREQAEAAQLATEPAIPRRSVQADPAITELVEEDGREYLTGGNLRLRYYNQGDEAWASAPFGRDPIGGYGCGPTALSMVVASMAEASADPAQIAAWAAGAGYAAPGSGSYLSIVQGVCAHYGLECASLEALTVEEMEHRLSMGGVLVALMGPGHFTARGHFILIHGVTLTGGVLVADPNSRENSLTVWDPEVILSELSPSRHDGAPLWLVTRPDTL